MHYITALQDSPLLASSARIAAAEPRYPRTRQKSGIRSAGGWPPLLRVAAALYAGGAALFSSCLVVARLNSLRRLLGVNVVSNVAAGDSTAGEKGRGKKRAPLFFPIKKLFQFGRGFSAGGK